MYEHYEVRERASRRTCLIRALLVVAVIAAILSEAFEEHERIKAPR